MLLSGPRSGPPDPRLDECPASGPLGARWPFGTPISLGMRLPVLTALRLVPTAGVEGPPDLPPSGREPFVPPLSLHARLRPHAAALVPGLLVVGLMLVWAVHDGGYDAETWYWGSLAAVRRL